MPVIRKRLSPVSPEHARFVQCLADELQRKPQAGPEPPPVIVEEEQRGDYLHVTVVWTGWRDLTPEERGRVIMDAYQKARPDDVLRINVALGLTPAEAERLGVPCG